MKKAGGIMKKTVSSLLKYNVDRKQKTSIVKLTMQTKPRIDKKDTKTLKIIVCYAKMVRTKMQSGRFYNVKR